MHKLVKLWPLLAAGWLVLGCARETAEETTETVEPMTDTMAAAPTISLADVAGTWDMRAIPESGTDTTATVYQIQVTGDGFTYYLPDRDPIEASVTTSGDSLLVEAGPFQSVRREGMTVRTNSVFRLEGSRMVGTTVAHYETGEADSVLRLRVEGTRAP